MNKDLLSESGLSLERLAGFLAVADAGSIAGVAPGDPSRPPLLSRQIKDLEAFFGAKLTRRVGRGLELTDAGREKIRQVLPLVKSFRQEAWQGLSEAEVDQLVITLNKLFDNLQ